MIFYQIKIENARNKYKNYKKPQTEFAFCNKSGYNDNTTSKIMEVNI